MPDTIACRQCERTFYSDRFRGRILTAAIGVCQWCIDPSLDPLSDEHENAPAAEDESNATIYQIIGEKRARAIRRVKLTVSVGDYYGIEEA